MENVQNILLQMATTKQNAPKTQKPDDKFSKMMDSVKAKDKAPESAEQTPQKEEINVENMQQLAAMQAMQTVIIPMENQNAEVLQTVTFAQQTPIQMVPENAAVQSVAVNHSELPQEDELFADVADAAAEAVQQETPEKAPVKTPETSENTLGQKEQPTRNLVSEMTKPQNQEDITLEENPQDEVSTLFRNLDAAPVKVSEAAVPVKETEAGSVANQVMAGLQKGLEAGERRIEVQLDPQNLGKIRIELTEHRDGSLQIALHAEHSNVRAMLESKLPEMQQILKNNTQQDVQIQLPQQEKPQQQFYDQQNGQRGQQQEQHHQQKPQHQEDFLNQLRLGLIPQAAS